MRNTSLFIATKQSSVNIYNLLCGQISFCNLFCVVSICAFILVGQVIATPTDDDTSPPPTSPSTESLLKEESLHGIPTRNHFSSIRFPVTLSMWDKFYSYAQMRFNVPFRTGYEMDKALCGWIKSMNLICGDVELPVTSWIPEGASFPLSFFSNKNHSYGME